MFKYARLKRRYRVTAKENEKMSEIGYLSPHSQYCIPKNSNHCKKGSGSGMGAGRLHPNKCLLLTDSSISNFVFFRKVFSIKTTSK